METYLPALFNIFIRPRVISVLPLPDFIAETIKACFLEFIVIMLLFIEFTIKLYNKNTIK